MTCDIPAQHKFRVLGHVLLDQVLQQGLHDLSKVLQFVMEGHSKKTSHITAVSLRETLLCLQSVDKLRHKTNQGQVWIR